MPAVGFHKVIDVEFGDTLRVNTCALVLTLAEVPREVEDVALGHIFYSIKFQFKKYDRTSES